MKPIQPEQCFIACGANLGESRSNILSAYNAIESLPDTVIKHISPFYQSRPQGDIDQPDFINSVIEITTSLLPHDLLFALQIIENQHGRMRTLKWGPRSLDLDIILYGNIILQDPDLILPHPACYTRDFVLKPLKDIAPYLIFPNGKTIDTVLSDLSKQFIYISQSIC